MVRLIVEERKYEAGSHWDQLAFDAENCLITSKDIDECPTYKDIVPKFIDDFTVRFYYVEPTETIPDDEIVKNGKLHPDLMVIEELDTMSSFNLEELRDWFVNEPVGKHVLETEWDTIYSDDDLYLKLVGIYPEKEIK